MNTEEIKIISLWQPWATLIALGLKKYETRSWGTPYRGKLAIHAAKRPMVRSEVQSILYGIGDGGCTLEQFDQISRILKEPEIAPLGCILAIANLTDCEKILPSVIHSKTVLEKATGDWGFYRYAWKLDNVITLPEPILVAGKQGLRTIQDAGTLAEIDAQIQKVAAWTQKSAN